MSPAKASPQSAKSSRTASGAPRTIAGTVDRTSDPARQSVLAAYQEAVLYMQQGNYSSAHPAFEDLLKIAPPEFTDRIRMYLTACIAQTAKNAASFGSPEEKYDYAISLLNDGQYEDAREHLDEILAANQDADYALYGIAVLASITGDSQTCLDKLTEAIRLNPHNRIQARADSDFQEMADDPRFTELLYPDA